jgi:hypothetical protein
VVESAEALQLSSTFLIAATSYALQLLSLTAASNGHREIAQSLGKDDQIESAQ